MRRAGELRQLALTLGVPSDVLAHFGVRATESAQEATGRIVAVIGVRAWAAAQRTNAGPARGAAVLAAKRAGSTYERRTIERRVTDGGDEPCAREGCGHGRDDHPDDGPCEHDACACDGYESSDESDAPPSSKPGRGAPEKSPPDEVSQMATRSTASPERLRASFSALKFGARRPPPTRAEVRQAMGHDADRLEASERALIAQGVLPPRGGR
jgi:hypothetical protein